MNLKTDADSEQFGLQMVIENFQEWVKDQRSQAGGIFCNYDFRIETPFDNYEHSALWVTHDCKVWDLYLTVIMSKQSADLAVTWSGAELSDRRGCFEIYNFVFNYACEFYLPHGGDNFGILFATGSLYITHDVEWVYNPGVESFFGGW